jgi:beta-lactam-binding protein with PASTA domain
MNIYGATRALAKAHCTVGEVVRAHTGYAAGHVAQQQPGWGKTFPRRTSINLTISLGPA